MDFWETTPYLTWYKSHRKFSILAHLFIADFEENKPIHLPTFTSFIKSLYCHSKSEEKMFSHIENIKNTFIEHNQISITKSYTEEEKYILCKSLIMHMEEEEDIVKNFLLLDDHCSRPLY
jgi:hypothetical protein